MAVSQLRADGVLVERSWCGAECRAIRQMLLLALTAGPMGETVVSTGALTVDRWHRTVHVEGREIHVTSREWAILDYLAAHVGRVCPVREIRVACWGPAYATETHLFRVNVARLRGRLGRCASLIEALHYRGYRLVDTPPVEYAPVPSPLRVRGSWSTAWDRCRDCGTTERQHSSHGRCDRCRHRHARGGAS
jgi:DNA-binding winged helix-turn-helix (wHTH) protein